MNQVPDITLAHGERARFSEEFSPNIILTQFKTTMVITDRRVIVRQPNAIFGIIPRGYNEQTSPLRHVSQINAGESFSTPKLIQGGLGVIMGLYLTAGMAALSPALSVIGLLVVGLGAFRLYTAHELGIGFRNHGGGVLFAAAAKSERAKVEAAKRAVNDIVFAREQPVDSGVPAAPVTDPTIVIPAPTSAAPSAPSRFTAAQASDPTTPQAVLSQIAEHEPSLRSTVAGNPNCYPGLLEWLRGLGDPEVERALAARV
ncbi:MULTISPECIES: variant leucine-rich repeat-containing protein [Nocardiaceae]|uniref:Leucine rich repeat variant domain-containing protein n=1 Tax=Rhodococcoides kroppenstedtii TaxID=293050 RepID=A0ABS7NTH6_9NOCA|nr:MULTISPECIES: hypothetical protein [Rhodococcus]AMY20466.1 hypothetical protein A3Q40_03104 [Rhodococcus sp. PBTS 1]MBY6315314.1 hypothetical protein [Rhodococcus kroppenstedtii]MBY6321300.1 hypothetical protein [Rhodococcus kroppenstedtii]MBY6400000.1 hypothetical protein [Rhodococcus kroppenstedtii]